MPWQEYINLLLIKTLCHHTSGTLTAFLLFSFIGWIIKVGMTEGFVKSALQVVDGTVLIGLFVFLAIQMFQKLIKGGKNGSPLSILVS